MANRDWDFRTVAVVPMRDDAPRVPHAPATDPLFLPVEEAFEKVQSGTVALAYQPDHPPMAFLEFTLSRLSNLENIGPMWLRAAAIQKFEEEVLASGQRRVAVAGRLLNWLETAKDVSEFTRSNLTSTKESLQAILSQAEACFTTKLRETSRSLRAVRLSHEEQFKEGCWRIERERNRVAGNFLKPSPRAYEYANIGAEWVSFGNLLERSEDVIDALAIQALNEGRILAVRTENGRSQLVPPNAWNESSRLRAKDKTVSFLPSRDLPQSWLHQTKQHRGQERAAILETVRKFFEKLYLDAAPHHDQQKKAEMIDFAIREYGIPKKLALDAWEAAAIPNWKKSGRRGLG